MVCTGSTTNHRENRRRPMPSSDRTALARACYRAYETGDRDALEHLIADEFAFWSPYDDGIDRATYFKRCWPNHDTLTIFDFRRLYELGDEVFVTYEVRRPRRAAGPSNPRSADDPDRQALRGPAQASSLNPPGQTLERGDRMRSRAAHVTNGTPLNGAGTLDADRRRLNAVWSHASCDAQRLHLTVQPGEPHRCDSSRRISRARPRSVRPLSDSADAERNPHAEPIFRSTVG